MRPPSLRTLASPTRARCARGSGCSACRPSARRRRAPGRRTLESGEPRFEGFEPRAGALEDPGLRIELIAAHEIELAQPLAQHRAKVRLEIRLNGAQRRRHSLEQLPHDLIDAKGIHYSLTSRHQLKFMPRYGALQSGAAPKRCSQHAPPPPSPSKSHAVSHGTEAAPFLRASLAYALPVRACSRCLSRKRGERERHVHACTDCTSSAVADPRTWSTARDDAGTGAGSVATAGPRGRRPRAEQGRHRLDAYLDCARTVDVGTGAGALLRRTGAHEEHAVGAHAGLRRFLAGDGALVRLRLLACLHPG